MIGVIAYMKNNQITTKELMKYIKGPDFPTGGIIVNKDDLLSIYDTGTGKIKIRGKVETEKGKNGKTLLVISEIPYPMIGANIGKFLNDVAALVETKKDHGYSGYFQSVLKRGDPYRPGTEKGRRCGKSYQHAVQEDTAGGYLWSEYAGCGGTETGDSGTSSDH